jgi:heme oxygenase
MISAIAALRSATSSSHQLLERRLDVKTRFTHLDAYRTHIERMWGFCVAFEQRLTPAAFGGALPDYDSRRKAPLLRRDLRALGADERVIASLAKCHDIPPISDPAAAFGCLYVLEGATLGGRTLLPLVQSRLGLTAAHGAAYLASYGEAVTAMWRDFGMALDHWCAATERQLCAARAAVATFDALANWLCGDSR